MWKEIICGLFETLSRICLERLNTSTKNDGMVSLWAENEIWYSPYKKEF
jgi:hypothetical protein